MRKVLRALFLGLLLGTNRVSCIDMPKKDLPWEKQPAWVQLGAAGLCAVGSIAEFAFSTRFFSKSFDPNFNDSHSVAAGLGGALLVLSVGLVYAYGKNRNADNDRT